MSKCRQIHACTCLFDTLLAETNHVVWMQWHIIHLHMIARLLSVNQHEWHCDVSGLGAQACKKRAGLWRWKLIDWFGRSKARWLLSNQNRMLWRVYTSLAPTGRPTGDKRGGTSNLLNERKVRILENDNATFLLKTFLLKRLDSRKSAIFLNFLLTRRACWLAYLTDPTDIFTRLGRRTPG